MSHEMPSTVADLVRRSARRWPTGSRCVFGERRWTYEELDDAVTRVAGRLLEPGSPQGDRVAAAGHELRRLPAALPRLRPRRARARPRQLQPGRRRAGLHHRRSRRSSALFADPALVPAVEAIPDDLGDVRRIGTLRDGDDARRRPGWALTGEVPDLADVEVKDDDLVQLLYTSGTTAAPKGAMMTHRAFVHEYVSCVVALDMRADDVPLHPLPLYHSAQMHAFLMPYLMLGATNHVVEKPDRADDPRARRARRHHLAVRAADRVDRDLRAPGLRHPRPERAAARPTTARRSCPCRSCERLRDALPRRRLLQRLRPVARSRRWRPSCAPRSTTRGPDSAGRPVLFVEIKVVDDDGNAIVGAGQGEVLYRSPQLCTGYWDKPEETEEAFARRLVPLRRSRAGRRGGLHLRRRPRQGRHQHRRRAGRQPRGRGGALHAPGGRRGRGHRHAARAVDRGDHRGRRHARARRPRTSCSPTPATQLAPFKLPKAVHFVDALPKNPSGKLLKRELRERFGDGTGSAVGR